MFGELPSWGFYIRHADGVTFKNVTINARDMDFRPAYVLDSAKNITIVDSDVIPMTQTHQLVLKDAENILISNLKVDGKTMKEVPIYGKSLHIEGIEALH